ncbi:zinc finger BED domain-containing protein 1-like [Myzus persicae]|uniref:zinc finger BED domain-containing protein 1-like n=1 Tax=Myzus persicae TaxID=13164 RepID=UPI000B935A20|nr:zinc finger BED domain-containing protein 1-like [Myzus persicae]
MPSVQDEITKFARKHEIKLDQHTNPAAIQLLDNSQDIRRLKRRRPYDLLYEKAKEKVRNNLLNAKYISFTTDGWTSLNNDRFIAVTVHFMDPEECILKTFLLGCFNVVESHTAVNLSLFLNDCFKEWNITEKVKVAVSDNAANITSAIGMNQNWRHIPCLAHTLNLIAQSGLGEIKHVHKKVKTIVEYFKQSTKANLKLKNTQKQMGYPELKLIQDVCTRWNSTYDMFQRCIDIKEPLMSTIAIIGNMDNLIHEDFELIKHYCAILKPFKEVTIELSSEKGISISKVIISIKALHLHIKNKEKGPNLPSAIHLMLSKMITKANTKFENIENQPILTEATLLDPRFKKKAFSNTYTFQKTYENIKQRVAGIIHLNKICSVQNEDNEKTIPTDREDATSEIWQQFDSHVSTSTSVNTPTSEAIVELDRYLNEPIIYRKSDPLKWWNDRKKIYPNLFDLMLLRLCVPSTSVLSERTFSKAGYTISERRNRLSTKNAEMLRQVLKSILEVSVYFIF